jgi:hypothetical protein
VTFVADLVAFGLLGLLIGGLARFAIRPPRLTLAWTTAVGVAGTVFGGLLGRKVLHFPGVPVLAVLVSMAILAVVRWVDRRRTT